MNPVIAILIVVLWGGGAVALYGDALRQRLTMVREFRDRRSRREFVLGLALFIAALCSALSIASVVFMIGDATLRRALAGMAWGAFMGAGVLFRIEARQEVSERRGR